MYGFRSAPQYLHCEGGGAIAKPIGRLLNKMCDYNVKGDWFCIRTH
jgi:hypothetical protein